MDVIRHAPRERVSWNQSYLIKYINISSHAPRERVSWNEIFATWKSNISPVTLHVSVWVEMIDDDFLRNIEVGHAPRERVSWNFISFVLS